MLASSGTACTHLAKIRGLFGRNLFANSKFRKFSHVLAFLGSIFVLSDLPIAAYGAIQPV